MGYYRGDYYRGDYYRGDPFLGALAGAAIGKIGGAIGRGIGRLAGRVSPRTVQRVTDIGGGLGAGFAAGRGQPISLAPISMPGAGPGTAIVVREKDKDGKRSRRMNPLNPRALRRALRRAEGFEKFAARTVNSLYRVIDGRKVRTFKKKKAS